MFLLRYMNKLEIYTSDNDNDNLMTIRRYHNTLTTAITTPFRNIHYS